MLFLPFRSNLELAIFDNGVVNVYNVEHVFKMGQPRPLFLYIHLFNTYLIEFNVNKIFQ